jgi:uncharacterized membrane protein HdeD (DUF308 family)
VAISALSPARIRQASGWSIVWGIALVVFGMLAIAAPGVAAIAVNVFISWMIVFAGVVHLVLAFHAHRTSSLLWKVLVGLAYVAFGTYLLMHPLIGVASLTLLLATLFLVEGVLDIMMWWKMRATAGASWVLMDAIVTLLLGGMIYVQWPSSSMWAIGTLVGVSMIMSGISRVMLSLAARRAARDAGTLPFRRAA